MDGLWDEEDGQMYYDFKNKERILKREWGRIYKSRGAGKIGEEWLGEVWDKQGGWPDMDMETLERILETLALNKAPGEDEIPNEVRRGGRNQ
jgi:hypothetical protein